NNNNNINNHNIISINKYYKAASSTSSSSRFNRIIMDDGVASGELLVDPPRPTGVLMKLIFLFHPSLLLLLVLPSILNFWVLFIAGTGSLRPFSYIVFLATPAIFQLIMLVYHSRSCVFLTYGRQAIARKYHLNCGGEQKYQLIDLQTQTVVALMDASRVSDETAMYLYIPISNKVYNMSYYESTFRVNAAGHWQVVFTWKAMLSAVVFGLLVSEVILLVILRHWFMMLF
ncbi:hypothetical protein SAMD00019534_027360, partial [Acytostelium subglobosum LB1]|uniref:hypothetical protein n=1 Tax=Acytostelium subglobosum LB1 TaxID=1410327 RepID=UPI00064488E8